MKRTTITLGVQSMDPAKPDDGHRITLGDVRRFVKMCEAAQVEYSAVVVWAPSSQPQVGMHASSISIEEDD